MLHLLGVDTTPYKYTYLLSTYMTCLLKIDITFFKSISLLIFNIYIEKFYDISEILKFNYMWQNFDYRIIFYLTIEIYKLNYI